jgi:AraC-like DNA-binding protein
MDLLDDVLKQAGLKSRLIGYRTFSKSSSLKFPCDKSVGFHVVTHGTAHIHQEKSKKVITLKKGDIALMSRGCHHTVSNASSGTTQLTLVSGAYQLWNDPIHPLFKEIPDWYVLHEEDIQSFDKLQSLIQILAIETLKPDQGSQRIVQSLLDVMFSLIMRRIIEEVGKKEKNWSHAILNSEIKKAVELMHSDVSKAWTLDSLAQHAGLSRAGFAHKFKKLMGDTPLHYLTMLRVQRAIELLTTTTQNIESIALHVGYQDAFGFSKVFKKMTGLPPRKYKLNFEQQSTHPSMHFES